MALASSPRHPLGWRVRMLCRKRRAFALMCRVLLAASLLPLGWVGLGARPTALSLLQAVNASDYAISQFSFLRKLLLVHGRWNYRRSSRVVCYLFYKSVMFAFPLIFYATWSGFR